MSPQRWAAGRVRPILMEIIAEILPDLNTSRITDDICLCDLGADSVERVEIVASLMHRLGRNEPLAAFVTAPDIGALVDRVSEECAS